MDVMNNRLLITFFEELKNIENRVAWFLAELSNAKKCVQKDKRNQLRTELVRPVFSGPRFVQS
jgi:hypothetical protein